VQKRALTSSTAPEDKSIAPAPSLWVRAPQVLRTRGHYTWVSLRCHGGALTALAGGDVRRIAVTVVRSHQPASDMPSFSSSLTR
jgi:hypothetical protein